MLYIGDNNDSKYYRINLDGLFYGIFEIFDSPATNKFYKSDFKKYSKGIPHKNETFNLTDSNYIDNTATGFNIPQNGSGDYKFIDFDYALGSENFKIGANFAYGFIGAGPYGPGSFYSYGNYSIIRSVAIGYTQLGLRSHFFSPKGIPLKATIGINTLFAKKEKNAKRRNGFGIDIDAKYYFIIDKSFKPYISGYLEFKSFEPYSRPGSFSPRLFSTAIGLTFGLAIIKD